VERRHQNLLETKGESLEEPVAAKILHQLLSGLAYMHLK
jgi:serine/threonine protein kinase